MLGSDVKFRYVHWVNQDLAKPKLWATADHHNPMKNIKWTLRGFDLVILWYNLGN